MEYWNIGTMGGEKNKFFFSLLIFVEPNISSFYSSSIPIE
jgi:hypothetical protein